MSLFSIFSKKPPEATSVAEALAGTAAPAKPKSRRSENRQTEADQLVPEKKRARRRLIGAVVIVLAVVIGLPMVLDSEPKPLNKNIVIQIPSKDVVTPVAETRPEPVQEETPDQTAKQPLVTTVDTPQKTVIPVVPAKSATGDKVSKVEPKPESRHSQEAPMKKDVPVKAKAESHGAGNEESARALAILGGADAAAKPTTRIVVQVGAFATQEKVTELQNKLSSAGIKSFTQKVATSSGDKIRVRVGPFSDKESAEKMKSQLEKLGINASLLSL